MSFLTLLAVVGNLLALLAILFERSIFAWATVRAETRMKATLSSDASLSHEDRERKSGEQRTAIRESKKRWDERTKWAVAFILISSATMLALEAKMSEDEKKHFVTTESLEKELAEASKARSELMARVKKLEEHVFRPPNDPGLSPEVKKEFDKIRAELASHDRRFQTIHKELSTITAKLKELEHQIRVRQQSGGSQASPG